MLLLTCCKKARAEGSAYQGRLRRTESERLEGMVNQNMTYTQDLPFIHKPSSLGYTTSY